MRHSPTLLSEYSKRVKQSRTATRLAFTNMTSITASTSILTARVQRTSTTTRLTAFTNVTKCIHQRDLQSIASSSVLTATVQRTSTAMRRSPTLLPEYSKRVQQSRTATRLAFINMTSN